MGFADQGCQIINFSKQDEHLWLTADCPQDNGVVRTSRIDLNLCIGLAYDIKFSPAEAFNLVALNIWKELMLIGKEDISRNWHLVEGGRIFKCELLVPKSHHPLLNLWRDWKEDAKWEWREFCLNDHLNNVDGHLEFWAENKLHRPQKMDIIANMVHDTGEEERYMMEGQWIKGTVVKDWRICRTGS